MLVLEKMQERQDLEMTQFMNFWKQNNKSLLDEKQIDREVRRIFFRKKKNI